MVSDDLLVKQKWIEWREFNKEWSTRSFDDTDRWLEYKDKIGLDVIKIGVKWKIFYYPDKEHIAFTPEFNSYYKPILKFLLDANEKIMDDIIRNKELEAFIEYGFVQIVSSYLGYDNDEYFNLPIEDPEVLNLILYQKWFLVLKIVIYILKSGRD